MQAAAWRQPPARDCAAGFFFLVGFNLF